MSDHPIQGLMTTAMDNIRQMVDVNTIIGEAVEAPDGTIIIPVSRVSFGFGSGGSEYDAKKVGNKNDDNNSAFPFGGGCGGGCSIHPVAFLVIGKEGVKLLPLESSSSVDKIMDIVPDLMSKLNDLVKDKLNNKKKKTKSEGRSKKEENKKQDNKKQDNEKDKNSKSGSESEDEDFE